MKAGNTMKRIINNQEVEVQRKPFGVMAENWNEYVLEDGRTMRLKFVVQRICETNLTNQLGEKIFTVDGTPIFVVDEPENAANQRTDSQPS
jgi:hypothetical protein